MLWAAATCTWGRNNLAYKRYDAEDRVLESLSEAGKEIAIPPKKYRKDKRPYDKEIYKARHLIENFFCRLKQYRAIATRYGKTEKFSELVKTGFRQNIELSGMLSGITCNIQIMF